jgi:hypothetical protein
MAITYPLSTPTTIGIESITLSAYNATATSESPFTYKQQVFSHTGQKWMASVTIPTVHRDRAEDWVGFLLALKGQVGTFLLGDPNCTSPRGSASVTPGTPVVAGASQTGDTLAIDGLPTSVTGYLKRGDYIQLGSGSTTTLHKVLTDVDTDGSGAATLDIWPNLRSSPANNATVTLEDCKGRFRLVNPVSSWGIDNQSTYSISFEAVEALV